MPIWDNVVKLGAELFGTMALYQKSVLRKHLASQDAEAVKAAFEKYSAHFLDLGVQKRIRELNEEQYQQKFLIDLFVNILGYTMIPDLGGNLTTELKNIKDAKKTDGAILLPSPEGEGSGVRTAIAVIELKGTDTKDLDKVNDQAFNYKNNQPDCVYVITSNFEKLRFFIHNAVEHIEFNLFTLSEDKFALLWLFLQKDNLLGGIPAKVKEESLLQEDKITKALYADYSAFKNDLWHNMVQRNPQHDQLLLYKKSQKLLDRFLFIFFSEDKGLLPPNSISRVVDRWELLKEEDAYKPVYDIFKQYFGYMDTGRKGKKPADDISAYNGGLFKADELLDGLLIDDAVLKKHCLKLTHYDFADEVDTNILGHIFEHSLNDIENVRAQLAGEEVDKSKTKRKKDGVFYTPKYITKYIVDNTVGKLCEEKKAELEIDDEEFAKDRKGRKKATILKLDAQLKAYREWLLQLTICDPACGSGAFLNQALEFLMAEHRYVDELEAQLFEGSIVFPDVENHILENNIYGVDINEESVEIARLSLWLRTAQKGRKLTSLSSNIKCGNSLIDDPEVAGDLAFNWQNEFSTVFEKGGFDVVIGNPPYVRVQFLPYEHVDYYKREKKTAFKRVDISTLFFEQGHAIINKFGKLSFITSNQFQTTEYGQETREFIVSNFRIEKILDFGDLPVFEGALTYVSIYTFSKLPPIDFPYKKVNSIAEAQTGNYIDFIKIGLKTIGADKWVLVPKVEFSLLEKLEKMQKLGSVGNAWAGLFTGLDEVLMFDYEQMVNSNIELDLFLPVIRAHDPVRNGLAKPSKYVIYPYKDENGKTVVLSETELQESYPKGYEYLSKNKALLQQRKDSRKTFHDRKDWYALTRFGTKKVFNQSKIVSPGEVKSHKFSLDNTGSGFSCARVFAITIDSELNLNALLGILNSSLARFYLQRNSSVKAGGYFSYSSNVLNEMPLPFKVDEGIIDQVENSCTKNKELLSIETAFLSHLQSKFDLPKPSTKLQAWPSLDFKGFLAELKKAKVPQLGLEEEAEWMNYFNKKKAEANALQSEIDRIDKQIDQMVYALYGLTQEEIEIVENA